MECNIADFTLGCIHSPFRLTFVRHASHTLEFNQVATPAGKVQLLYLPGCECTKGAARNPANKYKMRTHAILTRMHKPIIKQKRNGNMQI
jgi:hypothetical protein